jgi:hypothetical protein
MGCPMGFHSLPDLETPPVFDHKSILALGAVTSLVIATCGFTFTFLPAESTTKTWILFTWHLFDAFVHFTLGGSFLYNVFSTSMSTLDVAYTRGIHSLPMTPAGVSFLGDSKRLYGAFYGKPDLARVLVWQEYAKADKRRGGADLTLISNELLAVFVLAPMAVYVCYLLQRQRYPSARYWMAVIAACELYGGFMAFSPEWLTGSPNLDTSNFLTLWVYLVFFNGLWVVFPLYILWDVNRKSVAR